MAALLYETAPQLKAEWIECLYGLARVFKDVDVEHGAIWGKRIQYWKSLRHPAALSTLQADVLDVCFPTRSPSPTLSFADGEESIRLMSSIMII